MSQLLDPVNYWAATSGFGSSKDPMSPFQNFSSNVARGYGSNFGSGVAGGGQLGIGTTAGFEPVRSATGSLVDSFLEDRRAEQDMASNALGALANIKIAQMQPQGGGAAPQQKKPSTGDRLWGLGTAVASAGVGAAVTGLI